MSGYVDLHCHGGGGADFTTCAPEQLVRAEAVHAAHGTTDLLASLVSAPLPVLCDRLALLADRIEVGTGPIRGCHLEGPYLAPARRGAHDPSALRRPDPAEFGRLLAAAHGTLRMITLAPELPGAGELIDAALGAGVVVAVGHTDATYEQAAAAFARGATVATHLGNAMRPAHHRQPGPVLAALEAPGVYCELIADGVHLHPAVLAAVARAVPDRVVLVTDAIAATGAPEGRHRLGTLPVTVAGGRATLADGTIAGSTLTMDRAVATAVAAGVDPAVARAAATTTPARLLAGARAASRNPVADTP